MRTQSITRNSDRSPPNSASAHLSHPAAAAALPLHSAKSSPARTRSTVCSGRTTKALAACASQAIRSTPAPKKIAQRQCRRSAHAMPAASTAIAAPDPAIATARTHKSACISARLGGGISGMGNQSTAAATTAMTPARTTSSTHTVTAHLTRPEDSAHKSPVFRQQPRQRQQQAAAIPLAAQHAPARATAANAQSHTSVARLLDTGARAGANGGGGLAACCSGPVPGRWSVCRSSELDWKGIATIRPIRPVSVAECPELDGRCISKPVPARGFGRRRRHLVSAPPRWRFASVWVVPPSPSRQCCDHRGWLPQTCLRRAWGRPSSLGNSLRGDMSALLGA